jgi:biotin carboxyl carrier protein
MGGRVKLIARVGDQEHQVDLVRDGQSVSVEIDGRVYSLEVHQNEENNYLLLDGVKVYDCRVAPSGPKQTDSFVVSLRSQNYEVGVVNPKKLRTNQNADQQHHGTSEIVAPMPGKVVKILVEEGAEVEKGAGIIIVEAMKMQNEMKAPRAGIVKSIKVSPGNTVNAGDVLAIVE